MVAFTYDGTITLSCSVRDLDRSIDWFRDVLGFEEVFKAAEVGWAEVTSSVSGVTIGLGQNEEVDGRGGTTPVFGVTDIDEARAELESKGVRFDGETQEIPGMVKLATFFDPDDNSYMLAQSLGSPG
jgi:catechol 2,3-dioxygenase-like lactoylglutathione lyase family enzyme